MTRCFVFIEFILLVIATVFGVEDIPRDVIPALYEEYKEAVDDAINNTLSLRRIFKNNKEYKIHVEKLKEVNGFKRHNLILREDAPGKSLIYVNNPVETKIPNAYLTLEEFKQLLTDRVSRQRDEFKKYSNAKPSMTVPTRTALKQHFITNPKDYERTMKITKRNKQSTIFDTYNRPPILNTQKLIKLKPKITVKVMEKYIYPNITEVTKDIIKKFTQIKVTNFTTKIDDTALQIETTKHDEERPDTNKVDIETTSTPETELTVTEKFDVAIESTTHINNDYEDAVSVNTNVDSGTYVGTEDTSLFTTTKATRRTLSRPLVFMGGYM